MEIPELFKVPPKLLTWKEVFSEPSKVPDTAGVYRWYFRSSCFQQVPTEDSLLVRESFRRLYVGISPRKPRTDGQRSKATLKSRIRFHFEGNAERSTLRLSLGCLLGIELRRVGCSLTFGDDEQTLNEWLRQNALVDCVPWCEPWTIERILINGESLPLNLAHNRKHPFNKVLSEARRTARKRAQELFVV